MKLHTEINECKLPLAFCVNLKSKHFIAALGRKTKGHSHQEAYVQEPSAPLSAQRRGRVQMCILHQSPEGRIKAKRFVAQNRDEHNLCLTTEDLDSLCEL